METLKLRIVEINTTAYTEEDFLLLTDLSDEQIGEVIGPIVEMEREQDIEYNNEGLVDELKNVYPNNFIEMYTKETIDYISI
jgi:hypothetical protein